jgi:transcriptional regulator with XRE-family HTH domain
MTERRKVKGVLGQMLAHIDENEMAKVSNRMLIAAKISGILHQRGVSQKQFATMMDKSESEISDWLSGDRNFTIDTLTDISRVLNIKLLNTTQLNVCQIAGGSIQAKMNDKDTAEIKTLSAWRYTYDKVNEKVFKNLKIG